MLLVTEVDCSELGQGGSSDQVGGDLSEGEMEGGYGDRSGIVVTVGFWRVVVRGTIPLLGGGLVELFLT